MVDVLVSVVHAEGFVDGGALVHKVDGAAGVGRDVTNGEQPADRRMSAIKCLMRLAGDHQLSFTFQLGTRGTDCLCS